MDSVEAAIKKLNDAINACHADHTINIQFAPWLASIVIGIYVVVAGQMVLEESLTLGAFIVTVDMYIRIADSWEMIYQIVLEIHSCLPSLELIFWHMNLPIDLQRRHKINVICTKIGAEERIRARSRDKDAGVLYAIDMLPIKCMNVSYIYPEYDTAVLCAEVSQTIKSVKEAFHPPNTPSDDTDKIAGVKNVSMSIEQGTLVALVGHRGQGKTTLLKILGGVLLPQGDLYVPTHLRVIHVPGQPMFFSTTLLENLRYGVHGNSDDGRLERVLEICRSVNVSEELIKVIEEETRQNWDSHLSLTQKMSLHLARALIANPDMLILHKPTIAFDSDTASDIMKTLKKFVEHRGLCFDANIGLRRRKTCIITKTRLEGCEMADKIFWVQKTGVKAVGLDELPDRLISS